MSKIKSLIERFTTWLHAPDPAEELELRVVQAHLDRLVLRDGYQPSEAASEAFQARLNRTMDEYERRMREADRD